MQDNVFASLLIVAGFAAVVPLAMVFLGSVLGPRRPSATKYSVYECGIRPEVDAKRRFSVKFYLVAVIFVVFDIEVAFLLPWAVLFRERSGLGALAEMAVFLGVLGVGLFYVIRRRALEWE